MIIGKHKTLFICQAISSDANRAQFNRVRGLCQRSPVLIISRGQVSETASQGASGIYSYPIKVRALGFLFPLWALWTVIRLTARTKTVCRVHTTYEPRTLILGFVVATLFSLEWIADLWDDPEKFLLLEKYYFGRFPGLSRLVKKIEFFAVRKVLRYADKVILGIVPEKIILKYKLHDDRVLAVTNGINLNVEFPVLKKEIEKKDQILNVFYCGVIEPIRLEGVRICFESVLKQVPLIRFVVAGPQLGRGYRWLQEELSGCQDRLDLQLKGVLPYRMTLQLASMADICICPYPNKLDLAGAYPVKIFDYMAMGRPVVASRLPGISAIVDNGDDGLLFEPGNYDEMAQHMLNIYQSGALKEKLSANAKRKIAEYSWDRINLQIFQFLDGKGLRCFD